MGRLKNHLDKGSILGLILMLLLLPAVPVAVIWWCISPVSIWQMVAMLIISIFLYIFFAIIEIMLVMVITE